MTVCGPNSHENPEIPPRLNPIPQLGSHGLWLVFSVLLGALTLSLVAGRTPGHRSVKKLSKLFYGCLVYADDIMLIFHTANAMRRMLAICDHFAVEFDLKFNNTNQWP